MHRIGGQRRAGVRYVYTCCRALSRGSHERSHHVASERLDEAGQGRHRAGHLRLRNEAHDANHGESAIVDLLDQASGLLLRRVLCGDTKRVVQREAVEVGLVERNVLEGRVLAGAAALHVVLTAELAPPLKEADEENNLDAALDGQVEPLLLRRGARRGHTDQVGEGEPVGLSNVAAECEHGDASVLDLRLAEETNSRLVRLIPECSRAKTQGVKVANRRVQLVRELLEASGRSHSGRSRARNSGRRERCGRRKGRRRSSDHREHREQ
mmetsp:Transcript_35012/g.91950  ORF Transcript_35012/g.91950 Transcript_35012/m.91950 type:complete len:268 (+) Transcript_35012:134-937(+)